MILLVIQNMMFIKEYSIYINIASIVYKFFVSKVALLDKKTMSGKGNTKHSSLERTKEVNKF